MIRLAAVATLPPVAIVLAGCSLGQGVFVALDRQDGHVIHVTEWIS